MKQTGDGAQGMGQKTKQLIEQGKDGSATEDVWLICGTLAKKD